MKRAILAGFVFLSQAAQAAVHPCPATLTIPVTVQPPAGLTAYEQGNPSVATNKATVSLKFHDAMFSSGPPEQSAWLVADAGSAQTDKWNFTAMHDKNVWVSCRYEGSALLLSAALPSGMSQCSQSKASLTCR